MRRLLTYTLALFAAIIAFGQSPADSVNVYFRIGHRQYDPALYDNRVVMDRFIDRIRQADASGNIDSIVIRAYASPDGSDAANERLARNRGEAIADYLIDRTGISEDLIRMEPGGVAWEPLRQLVADNMSVPSREKILDILDNTPIWVFDERGRIIDGRKKQLMDLSGGRPYRWMLANLFPKLRNAVAMALFIRPDSVPIIAEQPDTVSPVADETVMTPDNAPDEVIAAEVEDTDTSSLTHPSDVGEYCLALKTNLLYDIALLPNLELEWRVNRLWSVCVEGDVAFWSDRLHEKTYQLVLLSSEVRRWLRPSELWRGWYTGLFCGGGWYDLDFSGSKGYRGEGGMVGISAGYMRPIGRHFIIEAGLGVGYMYTRFKEYVPFDGHHIYQRTKEMNYFGPLKLKFSIGWRFCNANKSKSINPVL